MESEETASAVVERAHAELAICRYLPRVRVHAAALGENLKARMRVLGREAYALMAIYPENVDFDMSLLDMNLYTDLSLNEDTRVLAIVALGSLFEQIAYCTALNPAAPAGLRVFHTEEEARDWVELRIAEQAIR
ncbi:MAG: hypothetical protein ACOH13_11030 [Flavobacteriales bacterium]